MSKERLFEDLWRFIENLIHEFGEDQETALLVDKCLPEGELGDKGREDITGWLIGFLDVDQ